MNSLLLESDVLVPEAQVGINVHFVVSVRTKLSGNHESLRLLVRLSYPPFKENMRSPGSRSKIKPTVRAPSLSKNEEEPPKVQVETVVV